MHRLFLIAGLSLAPLAPSAADPVADPAPDPAVDPLPLATPPPVATHLILRSGEFQLSGYDTRHHVVAVRFQAELSAAPGRLRPVRLRGTVGEVHLVMGPSSFDLAWEAGRAEDLELLVAAYPIEPPQPPGATDADCDELVPERVELKSGSLVLARRDLREPLQPEPEVHAVVRVGRPQVDPPGSLPERMVTDQLHFRAENCLRRALGTTTTVRGALTVELRTSAVGRPETPTVVVDGVVNHFLTHCLVRSIGRDGPLWQRVPPGWHAFVPLYFNGEVITTPDEDAPPPLP